MKVEFFKKEKLIPEEGWRKKLFRTIYYADTPAGKLFDVSLLVTILLSTVLIIWESIPGSIDKYGHFFRYSEWVLTIFFTIEYYLRLLAIKNNRAYIFSAFGIIDLLSILTFYISLFFPQVHFLIAIRLLRLLRVFRIFNLITYLKEALIIIKALQNSYRKIIIFLMFIVIISVIVGSLMYVLENGQNGFHSIPESIYWAIVTITTVGYGDIAPTTSAGKLMSIILMLCGYGIIAVPTGIVAKEFRKVRKYLRECERCGNTDNDTDARYCKVCGEKLLVPPLQ
ncbi:MAG: ion transporter [Bacteroidetes bacterium 43-16]|nr:MAG: ion transporter [Bacteroidetes bacterium 43-16]